MGSNHFSVDYGSRENFIRVIISRMDSQLLYQQDVKKLEFEAEVVDTFGLPDGRMGIVLDRTYFYPTGGGQEHDNGTIGSAHVVDVYKDEEHSRLVHVVKGEVGLGVIRATIDAERRLRHMQHHTGQHLLTQCILRQTGYETVSANINGHSPSTLDIVSSQINKRDLDQAEQMANRIIYENRLVKTYFVTPEELQSIPLRRPPKVSENIRIVEIDSYDYSPCGGTHVAHTGSIGLVKVVRAERQNDKMRIHFIAGMQAMEVFHNMYDTFTGLANEMTISWQDVPDVVGKQAEQLSIIQKELAGLRQTSIKYEARQLAEQAESLSGIRLVRAGFANRSVTELRLLGDELKQIVGVVAYLSSFDGQKLSLIVSCGEGTNKDARGLLSAQLALIGGRGGGDARLAQGGGMATVEQYQAFLRDISLG
jgi:alanyl-tRNA synthetase